MSKFNIIYKKKIPGIKSGYWGMNSYAAKAHNLPWPYHEKDIEVLKSLPKKDRVSTERHEKFEQFRLKHLELKEHEQKSLAYGTAHKEAIQFEKLHKPFNTKTANKFVKQRGWK